MDILIQIEAFFQGSSKIAAFAPIFQLGCAFNIALERWKLRSFSIIDDIRKVDETFKEKQTQMEIDPSKVEKCGLTTFLNFVKILFKVLISIFGVIGKYLAILMVLLSFIFLMYTAFSPDDEVNNVLLLTLSVCVTVAPLLMFLLFGLICKFCHMTYDKMCDNKLKSLAKLKETFSDKEAIVPSPTQLD